MIEFTIETWAQHGATTPRIRILDQEIELSQGLSQWSVWLVSHKDELAGRVNNILTVVKENGFTNYSTDVEVI